jgi:hypothetical protein
LSLLLLFFQSRVQTQHYRIVERHQPGKHIQNCLQHSPARTTRSG